MSDIQKQIQETCDSLRDFLLEKNRRYGDSALNPKRIFSKLDNKEQIKIRIDDKISRISNNEEYRKNDLCDLIGYLVLLCIAFGYTDFTDLID